MCESREAEVELAEAAFGSSFQLVSRSEHETTFSIHTTFGVVLTFTIPSDFPRLPLRCLVNGEISNARRESISQSIHQLLEDCPDLGVLSVHQTVQDHLEFEITTQVNHENRTFPDILPSHYVVVPCDSAWLTSLSHHKRKSLVENALELRLGGYSKHGFPGIVVIEGPLEDVMEYVRRIQRLRWQHMVVRGEEIETIYSPNSMDEQRKFPTHFQEIDGNMSDLGALCRKANLHDLFMTALKKNSSSG